MAQPTPTASLPVNIRIAGIDEAEVISTLIYALAEKYVAPEFPDHAANALLVSMLPEGIRKHMRGGSRYHIAEFNGQVIGAISMKDNKHLYHLFVATAYQHQGVARGLWLASLAASQATGYTGEYTVNSSRLTLEIYEKLGFVAQPVTRTRDGVISIPMVYRPER